MRHIAGIILAFALLFASLPTQAVTPSEVMRAMSAKLNSQSGLSGNFSINGPGGKGSGSFKIGGKKAFISVPSLGSQWFDGKTLWSANPRTKEVTVSYPDAAELRDANPLLYLQDYMSEYRLFFSKRKEKGKYLVLLNPRKSKSEIKAIEVRVDAGTMLPDRIIIRDENDQRSTVTFSSLKTDNRITQSDFTFPAVKYKDYEIIDMR